MLGTGVQRSVAVQNFALGATQRLRCDVLTALVCMVADEVDEGHRVVMTASGVKAYILSIVKHALNMPKLLTVDFKSTI